MITMIFAHDDNFGIGKDNSLPWHLPEDMKWFKAHTLNRNVVMGRKTFESLKKPLPLRKNIVLTSKEIEGVKTIRDISELELFNHQVIIGGAQVYKTVMEKLLVDQLIVTHVKGVHNADTFIEYSLDNFILDEQHETEKAIYSIYNNSYVKRGRKANTVKQKTEQTVIRAPIERIYEFLDRNGSVTGFGYGTRDKFNIIECTHMTGGFDPSIAKYQADMFAATRNGIYEGIMIGHSTSPTTYRIRQFYPASNVLYRYLHRDLINKIEETARNSGANVIWTITNNMEHIIYNDFGYEVYSVKEDGSKVLFKHL